MRREWGSIRSKGRWIALRYVLPSGERVQESLPKGTTMAEAKRLLADRQYVSRHGTLLKPTSVTLGELLAEWLANEGPGWATNTRKQREQSAGRLTAILGGVPLATLTLGHVESARKQLQEGTCTGSNGGTKRAAPTSASASSSAPGRTAAASSGSSTGSQRSPAAQSTGLSPKTVNLALEAGAAALKWAIVRKLATENVFAQCRRLTVPKPNKTALPPADALRLFSACIKANPSDPAARAIAFGLVSSRRYNELAGLWWSDVDLEAKRYTVRRGWDDRDRAYLTEANAKHRLTTYMLSDEAITLLVRQRDSLDWIKTRGEAIGKEAWTENDLVFPSLYGTPLPRTTMQASLTRLCAKAGVARLSVHELRHTATSLLIANGAPDWALSAITGDSIAMIRAAYAHVFAEDVEAHVNRLGRLLAGVAV